MKKLQQSIDLTAAIIAHKLDQKLWKAMESVSWCPIILVIDTSAIKNKKDLKEFREKAKNTFSEIDIYEHATKVNHFSVMRNSALRHIDTTWTLFLDSDEWVTSELKNEILSAISKSTVEAFRIPRTDFFLGKEMLHGETASISLIRLGQTHKGMWKGSAHEVWSFDGEVGDISSAIHHEPHDSIGEFIGKVNAYTSILAEEKNEKGQTTSIFEMITYPIGKFLQNFFLKLGFLDGWRGLIYALLMSFHSFFMRVKLWEMQNTNRMVK